MERNVAIEFERNRERYEFLRWGQKAFRNFRVVPPAVGIVHQVNLEYLAKVRLPARGRRRPGRLARHARRHRQPHDDDQRPGRARLGRGRHRGRGRDARPAAVHARAGSGRLRDSAASCRRAPRPPIWCSRSRKCSARKAWSTSSSSTSGRRLSGMKVADRALMANMAPEYGATMGFFPVDEQTLDYLRLDRPHRRRSRAGRALRQGAATLLRPADARCRTYTKVLTLDLGTIEPCLAGPKRPQDRVPLANVKQSFQQSLQAAVKRTRLRSGREGHGPDRHGR